MPAKKTNAKATTKTATKKPKKATPAAPKKLSALDAAAQVLAENGGSMTTKELIETMAAQKLWESPNGQTPAATLYAAILRELTTKGAASRFKKTEPGKFAHTGVGTAEEVPAPAPKATKSKTAKGAKKKPGQKATAPDAGEAVATLDAGTPGTVPAA